MSSSEHATLFLLCICLLCKSINLKPRAVKKQMGPVCLQEPLDFRWHPLQRVRAISATVDPLIYTLRHKDVPVLIDGVRLRGFRHEFIKGLREDADVAPRVLGDPLQELLIRILILHNNTKAISHPKSHTAHLLQKKKGKGWDPVEVMNPYMDQVVQLDLHRSDLPVRDILLESKRNQCGIEKKMDLDGTWGEEKRSRYQDVQVLGLAMGPGEIGEEVLGERCRYKPKTNVPSRSDLESSRNKRTAPQERVQGVSVGSCSSTYLCHRRSRGTSSGRRRWGTTAAGGRKREAEENGRGREGDGRVCGERRSWPEERDKEDNFFYFDFFYKY
jgi:hypothetical protein